MTWPIFSGDMPVAQQQLRVQLYPRWCSARLLAGRPVGGFIFISVCERSMPVTAATRNPYYCNLSLSPVVCFGNEQQKQPTPCSGNNWWRCSNTFLSTYFSNPTFTRLAKTTDKRFTLIRRSGSLIYGLATLGNKEQIGPKIWDAGNKIKHSRITDQQLHPHEGPLTVLMLIDNCLKPYWRKSAWMCCKRSVKAQHTNHQIGCNPIEAAAPDHSTGTLENQNDQVSGFTLRGRMPVWRSAYFEFHASIIDTQPEHPKANPQTATWWYIIASTASPSFLTGNT